MEISASRFGRCEIGKGLRLTAGMGTVSRILLVLAGCGLHGWVPTRAVGAQEPAEQISFTPYSAVRSLLDALAPDVLPPELRAQDEARRREAWSRSIVQHDRDIRSRLARGNEDTIVNWLLLGTTFTSRPRALFNVAESSSSGGPSADAVTSIDPIRGRDLIATRAHDLVTALTAPGTDERRLFARRLLERKGYSFVSIRDRKRIEDHLLSEVVRQAREREGYERELDELREIADSGRYFAAQSKLSTLFRVRGLSLDTSFTADFAVAQAMQHMQAAGLLRTGEVRRVAIIGPGLDFADKNSGYDFYPQQTLQPFAMMDTLLRLHLADPSRGLEVTTLDISDRANQHLLHGRQRAREGVSYGLQLPLELGLPWNPDLVTHWNRIGDQISDSVAASKPSAIGADLQVRNVSVRPEFVSLVTPEDVNIVTQRLSHASFDLMVATNVFVYYNVFEQALAVANIEKMLRSGGFLVTNDAVPLLPGSHMWSAGYLTIPFSERAHDGTHMVWYERLPD